MIKKRLYIAITISLSLLICLIGGEVLARLLGTGYVVLDERNLVYRFDEELGWFPIENTEKQFRGSHLIHVKSNKLGFRDIEHGPKMKNRIAFIGDSFVWGYDVEQNERFTEILRPLLPNWEVLNMGVSGYGTDQAFLLIQKWFDHIQPDIVVLVFSPNDWGDNSSNMRYSGYYKPYFKQSNNQLVKFGTPVPKSMNYYHRSHPKIFKSELIRSITKLVLPAMVINEDPTIMLLNEINDYIGSKGAKFVLAFTDFADKKDACSFCESKGIQYLFLSNNLKYKTNGNHWTPKGHKYVSIKIFNFLIRELKISA